MNGCAMGAIVVAAFAASPAFAAGTTAGSTITNTVSVDYTVAGVNQVDATASDNITVDRKVNVTVARLDNTATSVTPGATSQVVTFTVQNLSNGTLDFALASAQTATGSPAGIPADGNDGFDVTSPVLYLDNGDNVYGADDTVVTHLNSLAADATARVFAVATVPNSLANGLVAALTLTATAKENDNGAAVGSNLTQAGSDTAGMDTIFADAAGVTDAARDGAFSATDDYVVLTAIISATKTSRIIAGVNEFAVGAAIPGALVEYCISVTNAAGGAAATGVAISDSLPIAQVTYNPTFGIKVGGPTCLSAGAGNGSYASPVVSATIGNMAAGTTQTVIFQATIN